MTRMTLSNINSCTSHTRPSMYIRDNFRKSHKVRIATRPDGHDAVQRFECKAWHLTTLTRANPTPEHSSKSVTISRNHEKYELQFVQTVATRSQCSIVTLMTQRQKRKQIPHDPINLLPRWFLEIANISYCDPIGPSLWVRTVALSRMTLTNMISSRSLSRPSIYFSRNHEKCKTRCFRTVLTNSNALQGNVWHSMTSNRTNTSRKHAPAFSKLQKKYKLQHIQSLETWFDSSFERLKTLRHWFDQILHEKIHLSFVTILQKHTKKNDLY